MQHACLHPSQILSSTHHLLLLHLHHTLVLHQLRNQAGHKRLGWELIGRTGRLARSSSNHTHLKLLNLLGSVALTLCRQAGRKRVRVGSSQHRCNAMSCKWQPFCAPQYEPAAG